MMKLTVVPQEEVAARRIAQWGDLQHDETLLELIRAEISARGSCPRWTVLQRLGQAIGGEPDPIRARLRELCDRLEDEGDLTASSGGVLNVTPIRAIALQEGVHRVVCSLPSHRLRTHLPGILEVDGLRRLHRFDPATEAEVLAAIQALGGVIVSPEAWAGLRRTPIADGAWLENLDQRLEWRSEAAGSLERDGALDWQGLTLTVDGPRWRRNPEQPARLWRARTSYSRWIWAWGTAEGTPSTAAFVTLFADDANRTLFAVAREAGQPVSASVVRDDAVAHLRLRERLPRAEYRYLTSLASPARVANQQQWSIPLPRVDNVLSTLTLRLGLDIKEEMSGTSLLGNVSADRGGAAVSLEQALPRSVLPPIVTQLLDRLRVTTCEDLLILDLEKVSAMKGVGRKKLRVLQQLQGQIRSLVPSAAPLNAQPSPDAVPSVYDEWSPKALFGRYLPTRARKALEVESILTFADLRRWHATTIPTSIANYGRRTHQQLAELIERVLTDGYEALHFGGDPPASVEIFAQRYLSTLGDRERFILERRFIDGQTLEDIGTALDLTRERVRQIAEKTLNIDRVTWGKRAEELLDPLVQAIDQRGGIALTSAIEEAVNSPVRWTLSLCIELAALEVLVDVIPGVTTTYSRADFEAARSLAKDEVQARLDSSLHAREMFEILELVGIAAANEEMESLASLMLRVTVNGDRVYSDARSAHNLYIHVLHEAGTHLSAREVADRVGKLDADACASPHNATAHFGRTNEVLHYDHGLWIHQDHLAISRDELDQVARLCLPQIRAAGGDAVSVRHLLDDLVESGRAPESLNEYTLRDAILQMGNVRGWRAGVDVAWLGAEVSRRSIREWVSATAPSLEQPFTLGDLSSEVASQSGNLVSSVVAGCMVSDTILYLGAGQWAARDVLFDSADDLRDAVRMVSDHLPAEGVISSVGLIGLHPKLREISTKLDERLLWSLGRLNERVVTKERGFLLWRVELGDRLWDAIGPLVSRVHPLLSAPILSDWLRLAAGWDGNATVAASLLQEGNDEGWLRRVGMGWYVCKHASDEEQICAMNAEPKVVRIAMGSQDFVRDSPARELFNEIRSQRGLFRVPRG